MTRAYILTGDSAHPGGVTGVTGVTGMPALHAAARAILPKRPG